MKIGIVGGTGREGRGLAVRWAKAGHDVFIGSRQAEKGEAKAAEFSEEFGVTIQGSDNIAACNHGEIIIVTVPYGAHRPTFESIRDAVGDKVVVDITVPLQPPKVRSVNLETTRKQEPRSSASCRTSDSVASTQASSKTPSPSNR